MALLNRSGTTVSSRISTPRNRGEPQTSSCLVHGVSENFEGDFRKSNLFGVVVGLSTPFLSSPVILFRVYFMKKSVRRPLTPHLPQSLRHSNRVAIRDTFRRRLRLETLEERRVFATYDLGYLSSNYFQQDLIASSSDLDRYYYGTLGNGGGGTGVLLEFNPLFGSLGVCLSDAFGNQRVCANGNALGQAFVPNDRVPGLFRADVGGFPATIFGSEYRITFGVPAPVPLDLIDATTANNNILAPTSLDIASGSFQGTIHFDAGNYLVDQDWYSIETNSAFNSSHFVSAEFNHNLGDVDFQLIDMNERVVAWSVSVSNQELIGLDGLPAGKYFLRVFTGGQTSPGYRLTWNLPANSGDRLEPNNTLQTATNFGLIEGEFLEEGLSILPSGDEDWFRFAIGPGASQGHEVEIQFLNALGDVDIALFDAAGNPINYSFSTADSEIISLAFLPAGIYSLAVFGFYGSTNGEYQLRINAPRTATPDSTESKPGPEPLGTLSGDLLRNNLSLHAVEDIDRFTFTLNAGATGFDGVTIVQPDSQPVSAILLDSAKNVVGIYDSNQKRLRFSALSAGTYELVVFGVGGVIVPQYSLRFTTSSGNASSDVFDARNPNNTAPTATDLGTLRGSKLYGDQYQLSIGNLSDEDWYRFTLSETAKPNAGIQISFEHDSGRGDLDMVLYRANGDGSLGALVNQSTGTSNSEQISLEGLAAGNYFIQVKGYAGKSSGQYQLRTFVPGPDALESPRNDTRSTATDIDTIIRSRNASGQTSNLNYEDLSIDRSTDQDWFKFTLQTGTERFDEILVSFANSLGDIDIKLFDSAGVNLVASSTGTGDSESIDLKALPAGVYYLQVLPYAGVENPNYRLSFRAAPSLVQDPFEPNNTRANAKDLGKVNGFDVWGDVDRLPTITANDEDWYRFEIAKPGTASNGVLIAMDNLAGDLDLELYDNAGTKLAATDQAASVEWLSLQNRPAGVYWIRVAGHAGATSPGYLLAVNSPWIPTPDVYEPNNTSATSTQLGTLNTRLFVSNLSIDTPNDVDQYTFRMDDAGIEGQFAAIAFDSTVGNLNLRLFSSTGTLISESTSTDSIETVSLAGLAAGQYRLEVSGAVNQYVLSLFGPASTSGDIAEGTTGNNTLAAAYDLREVRGTVSLDTLSLHQTGDVDWFKFTIPTGTTLSSADFVAIEHNTRMGDLDIELYNASGSLLRFQNASRASTTGDSIERVTLEGISASDGPVYIKVFGHGNAKNPNYRLTVRTALDEQSSDWSEPNATSSGAKDLQRVSGTRTWSNLNVADTNDKDWFKFSLVEGSTLTANHQIAIEFDANEGDLSLRLYKASDLNTPIRTSLTTGNREVISLAGLSIADGPFYIQVDGESVPGYSLQIVAPEMLGKDWAEQHGSLTNNNQRSNAYDLRTPRGTTVLPDLSIDPSGDVDYFKFTLVKVGGERDEIQLNYRENLGNLTLRLENGTGTTVRDAERKSNTLRLSLEGLAAGEYFVRIAGETTSVTSPSYQLVIAVPQEVQQDFAEQNDTPDTATDLSKLTVSRNRGFVYSYPAIEMPGVIGNLQALFSQINQTPVLGPLITYSNIAPLFSMTPVQNYNNFVSPENLQYLNEVNLNIGNLAPILSSGNTSIAQWTSYWDDGSSPTQFTNNFPAYNSNGFGFSNAVWGFNNQSGLPSFGKNDLLNLMGAYNPQSSIFGNGGATFGGPTLGGITSLVQSLYNRRDIVEDQGDSQGLASKRVLSNLSIHSTTDVDWFRFELVNDGATEDVLEVSGDAGDAILTIDLYSNDVRSNASIPPITSSLFSGTQTRVSLEGLAKGVYFVKVSSDGKTQANYSLSVSLQPATTIEADWAEPNESAANARDLRAIEGTRIVNDLTIHTATDSDWFTFQTLGRGTESDFIRVDGLENSGDIDLKLFASDGRELKSSITSARSEQLSLSGLAAGTYRIQVYGYQGSRSSMYSLTIVAPQVGIDADSLEPNNSINGATAINNDSWQSSIAGLTLHAGDVDYFKFNLLSTAVNSHSISLTQPTDVPGALIEIVNGTGNVVRTSAASGVGQTVSLQGLSGALFSRIRPVGATASTTYALHWDLPQSTTTQPIDEWTIMVYMTASDLETAAFNDINEMESALLPSNVNLVVFLDQSSGLVPEGDYSSRPAIQFRTGNNGVWGDTGVAVIQPDFNSSVISTTFQRWGEKNSASSETLTQFIAWSAQNVPAKNYALVMWDHGGGVSGSNADYESGKDLITIPEVRSAILAANVPLSLIAYDACTMATAEVSYAYRDLADVIVSSQDNIANAGYDYRSAFSTLTYRPDLATAVDVAAGMVASFASQYVGTSHPDTLVSLNTDALDNFTGALSNFVSAAIAQPSSSVDWQILRDGTLFATSYKGSDEALYRDLGSYMRYIATHASSPLRNASNGVLLALNSMVLSKTPDYRNSQGQSIFLPAFFDGRSWIDNRNAYLSEQSAFANRTQWGTFLDRLMVNGTLQRGLQDMTGSNGLPTRAFALRDVSGGSQTFQRLASTDGGMEWYRFTLAGNGVAGDEIRMGAVPSSARLYSSASGGSGTAIRTLTGSGANRKIDLAGLAAGDYLLQIEGVGDASKTFDFTFAVASKPNSADRASRHDTPTKALQLGVVTNDRLLTGFQLNATTEDWFEFENPREEIPTNRVLRVRLSDGATAKLELFKLDVSTNTSTSMGIKEGTGELAMEFTPGDGLRYRFLVKPSVASQNIPYHIVFDAQGADRFRWTNPINRMDVDQDQSVSPLDVLSMINDINQYGARSLGRLTQRAVNYLDVDGDGSLSPLDILNVINHLNARSSGAEGEGSSESPGGRYEAKWIDQAYANWADIDSELDFISKNRKRALSR